MEYRAMMDAVDLISQNYREGSITRDEWRDATVALHDAYIESNGLKVRCLCLPCREVHPG